MSSDEIAGEFRQAAADALNKTDEQIYGLEEKARILGGTCFGPLMMRAPKGDRIFTTTLCTTTLDQDGESAIDHVRVTRTKKAS